MHLLIMHAIYDISVTNMYIHPFHNCLNVNHCLEIFIIQFLFQLEKQLEEVKIQFQNGQSVSDWLEKFKLFFMPYIQYTN